MVEMLHHCFAFEIGCRLLHLASQLFGAFGIGMPDNVELVL